MCEEYKKKGEESMQPVEKVSFSSLGSTLKEFGTTIKKMVPLKQTKQPIIPDDEFNRSDCVPRSSEERTNTAVIKFNEANKERLVAEINRSGEIESVFDKLLPEYLAYKNHELKDFAFTPVSDNVVNASNGKKSVEIRCEILPDGQKQQEVKFDDGSKVNYITFLSDGKLEINGEEFDMPEGTVVETKSVNGRVFSKTIQTPNLKRTVINKPDYIDYAEQMSAPENLS